MSKVVVIEDAKRNDIGNTAKAYADGHLGVVETLDSSYTSVFDVDFLTVTPFLGSESLNPFVDVCKKNNKGIFVLVKTSNISSGEIQDVITKDGISISQSLAKYVAKQSESVDGKYGYSSIGAVVGATYPEEAVTLRKIMPKSYFLVPGYGVQGGGAKDILPCFNSDGLGAIINSSRGILYTHMSDETRNTCTREEYLNSVKNSVIQMQKFENIYIIQPTFNGTFAFYNIAEFENNKENFLTHVQSNNPKAFPSYKVVDAEKLKDVTSFKIKVLNYVLEE